MTENTIPPASRIIIMKRYLSTQVRNKQTIYLFEPTPQYEQDSGVDWLRPDWGNDILVDRDGRQSAPLANLLELCWRGPCNHNLQPENEKATAAELTDLFDQVIWFFNRQIYKGAFYGIFGENGRTDKQVVGRSCKRTSSRH